jgi:hypothetical protein
MCRLVEGRTGRASLPRLSAFADAHVRERVDECAGGHAVARRVFCGERGEISEFSEVAKMADGTKNSASIISR